ncbi:MAG TPA: hypothetical protein VK717_01535 [Opitutaceae bacterium]|nr:hypothetical protein [Opitutaceae bacterium]
MNGPKKLFEYTASTARTMAAPARATAPRDAEKDGFPPAVCIFKGLLDATTGLPFLTILMLVWMVTQS